MGCLFIGIAMLVVLWAFSVSTSFGVILLISFIGLGVYFNYRDAEKKRQEANTRQSSLRNTERELEGFSISQKYVSNDMDTSILLDEENKKVCIIYSKLQSKIILDYKDILESEILEDGNTITKTSRSSQIGGALLGGLLLGGVGAIIGGLSGEKSSVKEIIRVDLKIVINNIKKPVHVLNFLFDDSVDPMNGRPFGIKKDSTKYKDAISKANHWHSLMSVLIRRADEEDKDKEQANRNNNVVAQQLTSVADELRKLKQLNEEGVLTDEEFESQKKKLIGG